MSDTKKIHRLPPAKYKRQLNKLTGWKKNMSLSLLVIAGITLNACSNEGGEVVAQCKNSQQKLASLEKTVGGDLAAFALSQELKPMADLVFKDRQGKEVSFASFTGKTVLMNIWATWCAPCREEMPSLDSLQKQLGSDVFQVLPINIDRGSNEKPLAFYDEENLQDLPFYQDNTMGIFNTLKKQSLVFGLPATLLIDDNGCILGSLNGPADWASDDAKELILTATRK